MIPIEYAIRNLFREPKRLFQTVLGSMLVVFMVMVASALNEGMDGVLSASGSKDNIIVLGVGSEESLMRSEISEKAAGIAGSSINGIAEVSGVRAVSPEIHQMALVSAGGSEGKQGFMRGVTVSAPLVHRKLVVTEGEFAAPGAVMAGRLAWKKLGLPEESLKPGREIKVEDAVFRVAGVFAAPGTVMESEIWMDVNDLRSLTLRKTISCVVLRMDGGSFADVDLFTKQRLDLELSALQESTYFEKLSSFYSPIKGMTWMTALLIATGAILGGLNTLYAAFSPRIREIATLQAIGFSRTAIMLSLIQESTLAALCGAVAAAIAAVTILDGVAVSFSIGSFMLKVTHGVALTGLITGVLLGLLGALPPGLRCLLPPVHNALRSAA